MQSGRGEASLNMLTAHIACSMAWHSDTVVNCRCKMQRFDTVRVFAGEVLLEVKDLEAKVAETGQMILRGVNLTVREGEVRRHL